MSPADILRSNAHRGRWLEDAAFGAGVLVLIAFAAAEVALKLGVHFKPCDAGHVDAGTPWGLLIVAALLIAPKMIGRATAGRVWLAVGDRIAGRRLTRPVDDGTADGGES